MTESSGKIAEIDKKDSSIRTFALLVKIVSVASIVELEAQNLRRERL